MRLSSAAKLRIFGGLVLFFNLWLIGYYNLSGIPVFLLTFGFAIGFELLAVRPVIASSQMSLDAATIAPVRSDFPQPSSAIESTHDDISASVAPIGGVAVTNIGMVAKPSAQSVVVRQNDEGEEEFWSIAITEFDGPNRRTGVWAKSYAAAHGNEAVAKALYLQERVNQLSAQSTSAVAAAEAESSKQILVSRERCAALKQAFLAGKRLSPDEISYLALESECDSSLCHISDTFKADTLLHWCARYGLEDEARTLLSNGAHRATVNGNGQRPAMLAGLNSPLHSLLSEM